MLGRIVSLWRQDEWRALLFGMVYIVLYALISQLSWQAHRRTLRYRRHHQRTGGGPRREETPVLGEIVGLITALGYPVVMVVSGVFSPGDVGIRPVPWGEVIGPLLLGALAATAWLGMLWYQRRAPGIPRSADWASTAPLAVTGALIGEGHLAVCRAALMPLLGSYWGMWLGVALRMLATHSSPGVLVQLGHPLGRRRVYLDWTLDWISTAALALTGSLWAGLIVRALCRTALHLTVLRSAPGAPAGLPAEARADYAERPESAWEGSASTG